VIEKDIPGLGFIIRRYHGEAADTEPAFSDCTVLVPFQSIDCAEMFEFFEGFNHGVPASEIAPPLTESDLAAKLREEPKLFERASPDACIQAFVDAFRARVGVTIDPERVKLVNEGVVAVTLDGVTIRAEPRRWRIGENRGLFEAVAGRYGHFTTLEELLRLPDRAPVRIVDEYDPLMED
jgi:hypothetical protein